MRCKKIQELLKSDYLDGEVNQRQKQYIDEHLAQCLQCRSLEKELRGQQTLFQKAKRPQVPESVWQNIRDAIVTERLKEESSIHSGIFERLRDAIFAPRPAFALAGTLTAVIFVAILAGVVIQQRQALDKTADTEIITEYALNGENDDLFSGLGTNIEEYFL